MNLDYCEKCGTKLVGFIEGDCYGSKCPKCNVTKAVTSIYPILTADKVIYKIKLLDNNKIDYSNLKSLSRITGLNFSDSKELLLNGGVLFEDNAIIIREKLQCLDETNLKYIVCPNFPYKENK